MDKLGHDQIVVLFLSLGVLLASARVLGELARRFNQPAVLGEILAGILLGPTVLGYLASDLNLFLFPSTGPNAIALDALTTVAIALFLLVAGMEVDLSTIWRQGRVALSVGTSGMVFPFAIGFLAAWTAPQMLGQEAEADRLIFALFFATALSISALPVIAKTLMDLDLYRTDLGMVVIASAILNDLVGWIIFAIILGMIGGTSHGHGIPIAHTIGYTLAFAVFMLTLGRLLIHKALPWVQAHTSWPGGVLGFALSLALFGSALTEFIGVHAIFGAFLVGVAIGDSSHLREQTRSTIDRFVSFIFAPLFFASIGLKVDFAANFDVMLVLIVLVIACIGKVVGCGLGARWGGMSWPQAWAIGFGMNARGAMEIILGLLALEAGLIRERMFVALVVMALVTSIISGPMMQRLLRRKKSRRFSDHLSSKTFVKRIKSADRWAAIDELAAVIAEAHPPLDVRTVAAAVRAREHLQSTGLEHGVAVPHARMTGIDTPLVAVGMSDAGIDFNAHDGEPARLILMVLTPRDDAQSQIDLLADIGRTLGNRQSVDAALATTGYTEFLAWLNSGQPQQPSSATNGGH